MVRANEVVFSLGNGTVCTCVEVQVQMTSVHVCVQAVGLFPYAAWNHNFSMQVKFTVTSEAHKLLPPANSMQLPHLRRHIYSQRSILYQPYNVGDQLILHTFPRLQ